MKQHRWAMVIGLLLIGVLWVCPLEAQSLERIIADARSEGDLQFTAGAATFGGRKAFSEIEAAFNKKFGLSARIKFTSGSSMGAMAARVLTEMNAGRATSTDAYLGSLANFSLISQKEGFRRVEWSKIFPWVTEAMETLPREGVLNQTVLDGIMYNSRLIPKAKAPSRYEELIDPGVSGTWAGKMAIPPYTGWLVRLSMIWGDEKVKNFTGKLLQLAGGRIRYSEEERIISGEFPIMANVGAAPDRMWKWQARGAPLISLPGSTPVLTDYYLLGVPKTSARPNLAKLFVAFMASKEAQAITEKYAFESSHLVEGTRIAKYIADHNIRLQESNEIVDFFVKDRGRAIRTELDKMLRQ